jgi:hypothetical protein
MFPFVRATSEVERIQGQSMSHTTVHHRLQEFAQSHDPFGDRERTPFRYLLVDGTKVKLQDPSGEDLDQVEMRWALPYKPVEQDKQFSFEPTLNTAIGF